MPLRAPRPNRRDREHRRRQRRDRGVDRGARRARRPYAPLRVGVADHHRAAGAEGELRSAKGFHASRDLRRRALRSRCQGGAAGEHAPGAHCLCQGQSRQAQLCLRGARRHHPLDNGAACGPSRGDAHARALQGGRARAQRPAHRRDRRLFRQRVRAAAAGGERPRQIARGLLAGAPASASGHADRQRILSGLPRHLLERLSGAGGNATADHCAHRTGNQRGRQGSGDRRSSAHARHRAERRRSRRLRRDHSDGAGFLPRGGQGRRHRHRIDPRRLRVLTATIARTRLAAGGRLRSIPLGHARKRIPRERTRRPLMSKLRIYGIARACTCLLYTSRCV